MLTYALALVHLLLTMFTNFKAGLVKVIPVKIHGIIELVVGIALALASVASTMQSTEKYFYNSFSALVLIVWYMSNHSNEKAESA